MKNLSASAFGLKGICALNLYQYPGDADEKDVARSAYFKVLPGGGEKITWNETHPAPLVASVSGNDTGNGSGAGKATGAGNKGGREAGVLSVVGVAMMVAVLGALV